MARKKHWHSLVKVPRIAASAAALAGCLAFAGCMDLPPGDRSPMRAPAPAGAHVATAPEAPPAPATAKSKRWPPVPKSKPAPAAVNAAALPQAALPMAGGSPPTRLAGKNEEEIISLLGEPGDRHEAAPAKVWRYTSSACELELYFYLDVASNRFQVLQIRVDQIVSSPAVTQQCLESILDERQSR
jgi:hypothetical protein